MKRIEANKRKQNTHWTVCEIKKAESVNMNGWMEERREAKKKRLIKMHNKYSSTQSLIGFTAHRANIFRNTAAEHVWENRARHFSPLVTASLRGQTISSQLKDFCIFIVDFFYGSIVWLLLIGSNYGQEMRHVNGEKDGEYDNRTQRERETESENCQLKEASRIKTEKKMLLLISQTGI